MAVTLSALLVVGIIGGIAYAKDTNLNDEVTEAKLEVESNLKEEEVLREIKKNKVESRNYENMDIESMTEIMDNIDFEDMQRTMESMDIEEMNRIMESMGIGDMSRMMEGVDFEDMQRMMESMDIEEMNKIMESTGMDDMHNSMINGMMGQGIGGMMGK